MDNCAASELLPAANQPVICLLCCRSVSVDSSESWISNVFQRPLIKHICQAVALNIDYDPSYPTWICPTCVTSVRYSIAFASTVYSNLIRHRSRFYGLSPTAASAAAQTLQRIEQPRCQHPNNTSCYPSTLHSQTASTLGGLCSSSSTPSVARCDSSTHILQAESSSERDSLQNPKHRLSTPPNVSHSKKCIAGVRSSIPIDNSAASELLPAANQPDICLLCYRSVNDDSTESWISNVFQRPLIKHIRQAVALNIDYDPSYPTWMCLTCVKWVSYSIDFACTAYTNLIRHRSRFYGLSPTAASAAAQTLQRIEQPRCRHPNNTGCYPSTTHSQKAITHGGLCSSSSTPSVFSGDSRTHILQAESSNGRDSLQNPKHRLSTPPKSMGPTESGSPNIAESGDSSGQRLSGSSQPSQHPLVSQQQPMESTETESSDFAKSDGFDEMESESPKASGTNSGGCANDRNVIRHPLSSLPQTYESTQSASPHVPIDRRMSTCDSTRKKFEYPMIMLPIEDPDSLLSVIHMETEKLSLTESGGPTNLRYSKKTAFEVELFNCQYCRKMFRRNYDRKRHELLHRRKRAASADTRAKPRFACKQCDVASFPTQRQLSDHIDQKHPVPRLTLTCVHCNSDKYNTPFEMTWHEATCTVRLCKELFKRADGGIRLRSKSIAAQNELRGGSQLTPTSASGANNRKPSAPVLKRRAVRVKSTMCISSQGELPGGGENMGSLCTRDSTIKDLRSVIQTNDNELHLCSKKNTCVFNSKWLDEVMLHEEFIHGILKNYPCSICREWFSAHEHLERHHLEAHRDDMNVCILCGESTTTARQLQSHMQEHDDLRRARRHYPCMLCPCEFLRDIERKTHYEKFHQIEAMPVFQTPKMATILASWSDPNAPKPFAQPDPTTSTVEVMIGPRCNELTAPLEPLEPTQEYSRKTDRPFPCLLCPCVFNFFQDREVHIANVHTNRTSDLIRSSLSVPHLPVHPAQPEESDPTVPGSEPMIIDNHRQLEPSGPPGIPTTATQTRSTSLYDWTVSRKLGLKFSGDYKCISLEPPQKRRTMDSFSMPMMQDESTITNVGELFMSLTDMGSDSYYMLMNFEDNSSNCDTTE